MTAILINKNNTITNTGFPSGFDLLRSAYFRSPDTFDENAVSSSLPPVGIQDDIIETDEIVMDDHTVLLTENDVVDQIEQYEQMYGMTSREFLRRVHAGTEPDTFETMLWKSLLRHHHVSSNTDIP